MSLKGPRHVGCVVRVSSDFDKMSLVSTRDSALRIICTHPPRGSTTPDLRTFVHLPRTTWHVLLRVRPQSAAVKEHLQHFQNVLTFTLNTHTLSVPTAFTLLHPALEFICPTERSCVSFWLPKAVALSNDLIIYILDDISEFMNEKYLLGKLKTHLISTHCVHHALTHLIMVYLISCIHILKYHLLSNSLSAFYFFKELEGGELFGDLLSCEELSKDVFLSFRIHWQMGEQCYWYETVHVHSRWIIYTKNTEQSKEEEEGQLLFATFHSCDVNKVRWNCKALSTQVKLEIYS